MKKIIITEDNYENIMFDLVENNYSKDNTEDLLNQIDSDVFLKFEWQQWNKAKYDESTEVYKNNEKEFIESLLQTEDKKFLPIGLIWRYSVAASILLLLGFYYFFSAADTKEIKSELFVKQVDKTTESVPVPSDTRVNNNQIEKKTEPMKQVEKEESTKIGSRNETTPSTVNHIKIDTIREVKVLIPKVDESKLAVLHKSPKYKITVVESKIDEPKYTKPLLDEKRYTMLDVLNRKDGISLSKFLHNSSSRIVKDSVLNTVSIEYLAEDNSILVVQLSN